MIIGAVSNTDFLRAEISPSGGAITVANGTSVNCTTVVAIITGGFPPYTYSWTEGTANISMQASTSVSSGIQATGTDTLHTVTVVLVATDSHAQTITASAVFGITQGSPP